MNLSKSWSIAIVALFLAGGLFMATPRPAFSDPANSPAGEAASAAGRPATDAKSADANPKKKLEQVTFGSGCFWCTEAVFAELKGVESAVSGYSGGRLPNPTYEQVCTGATGHAEVIQVTYDPQEISFPELLEVFWMTHDPTTLNQQGPDHGTQYRSAVFYHNDEQRRDAEFYKNKLNDAGAFDGPVVTEITKFDKFYPAEKYHQDYFALNPNQGYCRAVIKPKLAKFRKAFGAKLKGAKPDKPAKPLLALQDASGETDPDKIDWKTVPWKKLLTPEQYDVTRRAGTERPGTGKYWNLFEDGEYQCSNCGLPLFESTSKFDAHCGWPSFDQAIAKDSVVEHADNSAGMRRIEVRCRRCDAHLGHVFDDGPTQTGLRYCMNSASLNFIPAGDAVEGKDVNDSGEDPLQRSGSPTPEPAE